MKPWHPHRGGRAGGVLLRRPGAAPGVSLVVAVHASEASLIDLDGRTLHRWALSLEAAFPHDRADGQGWRSARLLDDGGLLVCCEGHGALRLDRASNLVWRFARPVHHDLGVLPGGRVVALARQPDRSTLILVLEPDGRLYRSIPLAVCFERGVGLEGVGAAPERLHANAVEILARSSPAAGPTFRAGALLTALPKAGCVALIDLEQRRVEWSLKGPWRKPHSPRLLEDGRLLVFDNLGASGPGGRSRVLEVDPRSGEILWSYQGSASEPFDSQKGGACQRLANGNTLVTESVLGRAFEVTREGERVWEFLHPARSFFGRRIPYLCEVRRLPAAPAWLPPG